MYLEKRLPDCGELVVDTAGSVRLVLGYTGRSCILCLNVGGCLIGKESGRKFIHNADVTIGYFNTMIEYLLGLRYSKEVGSSHCFVLHDVSITRLTSTVVEGKCAVQDVVDGYQFSKERLLSWYAGLAFMYPEEGFQGITDLAGMADAERKRRKAVNDDRNKLKESGLLVSVKDLVQGEIYTRTNRFYLYLGVSKDGSHIFRSFGSWVLDEIKADLSSGKKITEFSGSVKHYKRVSSMLRCDAPHLKHSDFSATALRVLNNLATNHGLSGSFWES